METSTYNSRTAGIIFAAIGFVAVAFDALITSSAISADASSQLIVGQLMFFQPLFFILIFACGILAYRRQIKIEGVLLIVSSFVGAVPIAGGVILSFFIFALFPLWIFGRVIYFLTKKVSPEDPRAGKIFLIVGTGSWFLAYLATFLGGWMNYYYNYGAGGFRLSLQHLGGNIELFGTILLGLITVVAGALAIRNKLKTEGFILVVAGLVAAIPLLNVFLAFVPPLVMGIAGLIKGLGWLRREKDNPEQKLLATRYLTRVLISAALLEILGLALSLYSSWQFMIGLAK